MKNKMLPVAALLLISHLCAAQTPSEQQTANYFSTIQNNPQQLMIFLKDMPKGGDLHNHTGGASMAENMIRYAQGEHLCVNRATYGLNKNAQCAASDQLEATAQDQALYNSLIDAWSMRNFTPVKESGHDHFFAVFDKYSAISHNHSGDMLAEISDRAGQQNESYLELMVTPELASSIGDAVGWDSDFAALRQKILAHGMDALVAKVSKDLDRDEAARHKILACDTTSPAKGCGVEVRYLFQVLREQQPVQVFAQLLAGFEAASKDPRIVGINMVQPEDGRLSMRDYKLHMQIVGFLHQLYPNVHISLHAGELSAGLVSPEGLSFHIRDAVEVAHAERIGHGVDVAGENDAHQLLQEMADKHIMVEINLSSNASILGVEGDKHPLPLYLKSGVPVALSTDDEGVLRTNLTEQYQKAILTYHFSYEEVKALVRNSLYYSFLAGENLWQNSAYQQVNKACLSDVLGSDHLSPACRVFLSTNEKARLQWDLEKRFNQFEVSRGQRGKKA